MAHVSLLFKSFQIGVLESFRGTVGGCCTKSLCSRYTANSRYLSTPVTGHIVIDGSNAAGESQTIGLDGAEFYLRLKFHILFPYSRNMKIKVNAPHLFRQLEQLFVSFNIVNINACRDDLIRKSVLQGLQQFFPAGCHAKFPSLFQKEFGDAEPHT